MGIPSPTLFGALLLGIVLALAVPGRFRVGRGPFIAAQATLGVVLGAFLQSDALESLADAWLPVAVISAGTLVLSITAGLALARIGGIDRATGTLGLIAGGASGIVSMADELGADARLVAFMQYLRVLVVVVTAPVVIALAFPEAESVAREVADAPLLGDLEGWLLTPAFAIAGALIARALRVPVASLLGPMILTGIVVLTVPAGDFVVPSIVQQAAFALIGLQVGLRFTVATVREAGRLLPMVLLGIAALSVGSAGLAVLLDVASDATYLDSYLATTPGGLYAVVAVAVGADADTTFIVGVQSLRLLVMVLLAPLVVRWLVRSPGKSARRRSAQLEDAGEAASKDTNAPPSRTAR